MNRIQNTHSITLQKAPQTARLARTGWMLVLLLLLTGGPSVLMTQAQSTASRSDGYVNLRQLGNLDDFFPSDASVEVNVEGALMRMVEVASRQEDPELADLLARLDGVFVLGYDLEDRSLEQFDRLATSMGTDLGEDGWTVVMRYRDVAENTHFYVRLVGDGVAGMVVMSVEEGSDQAVFVNIVGDIDPEQIGRIGQKFQIGGMREL